MGGREGRREGERTDTYFALRTCKYDLARLGQIMIYLAVVDDLAPHPSL